MLQPVQMTARLRTARQVAVPNNPGYQRFVQELCAQGVDVFDPTPASIAGHEQRYLRQDTHWTPGFMEETAKALAKHIQQTVPLPAPARPLHTWVLEKLVTHRGDLVDMLRLPPTPGLFPPEQALVRQVFDRSTDQPWAADPGADVLLLGDSFTN